MSTKSVSRHHIAGRGNRTKRAIQPWSLLLAALFAVTFTAGCVGNMSGEAPIASQHVSLQFSPSNLNFGKVVAGKKASQSASVTNTANTTVVIAQIASSNNAFTISGVNFPLTLTAGQTANFEVWFTGSAAGSDSGTLTFQAANGNIAPAQIGVSAVAAAPAPQLAVSPSNLDAGSAAVGSKTSTNVTLSNVGNADLNISMISVNGAPFSVSGIATPVTISAGSSKVMTVVFAPTSAAAVSGSITINSNDPAAPEVISVVGTGTAAPAGQINISPASVSFGNVLDGQSKTQAVTITNTGAASLTISQLSGTGVGFSVLGLTTPLTIAAGQSSTFNVRFAPETAGSTSGSIYLSSNAPNSPATIAVSGTGVASATSTTLSASPAALAFGSVNVGATSNQTVTITNTGSASLTISQLSGTGVGFSVLGLTTPLTIAAGQSSTFNVRFAPQSAGSISGSISLSSNASNSTAMIEVSGTGVASTATLSASPAAVAFGNVNAGTSANQTVTITNTGNSPATISQVSVTGANLTASGISTPLTLAPSQTATLTLKFSPAAAGSLNGLVTLTNAQGPGTTLSVTGAAVQGNLAVTPGSLSFSNVITGASSSQSVQVTNSGSSSLTISQANLTGTGFSVVGLSLPLTINAGQSSTFTVQFVGQAAGTVSGSLSLISNAANSPASVALSGTSTAATQTLQLSSNSISFGTVNAGSSANQTLTVKNAGNSATTITQVSVAGSYLTASGISTPLTLAPQQTATLAVQYSPTAAGSLSGMVTIVNNGTSSTVSVTGTAAQASISAIPGSVSFTNVVTGATNSQSVQLSNSGNASLTITQASLTGAGFSITGLSLPLTIAAGQTSTFNVQFVGQAAGTVSGSLSLVSNAANSPASLPLNGTSISSTATLQVSTNSLSFGSVNAGTTSTKSVTLTNTGNANVTVSGISIGGTNFSLSGAGAVTLSAGQTDTFSVLYTPTGSETDSGSVSIVSNATGSPAAIALSGTGVSQQTTHSVQLNWNDSDSTIVGYNVYRSTTSGTGYVLVNSSLVGPDSFSDTTVQSGTTYYYVTTAVDGSGTESAYSNEAQAIIP
jgi:ASPM-SPD-2-Hydin domain-containing protein/HYDIN/CFA65/VesB family protein/centrosomal CEP192-like protein